MFPNDILRCHFLTKCLMFEIVCSVEEQVCCRIATKVQNQRFCLRNGYTCLRYSNKNLKLCYFGLSMCLYIVFKQLKKN